MDEIDDGIGAPLTPEELSELEANPDADAAGNSIEAIEQWNDEERSQPLEAADFDDDFPDHVSPPSSDDELLDLSILERSVA